MLPIDGNNSTVNANTTVLINIARKNFGNFGTFENIFIII